jgi:hypothetical protein
MIWKNTHHQAAIICHIVLYNTNKLTFIAKANHANRSSMSWLDCPWNVVTVILSKWYFFLLFLIYITLLFSFLWCSATK